MFEMEASRAGLGRGWTEATASFVGRCDLSSSLRSGGFHWSLTFTRLLLMLFAHKCRLSPMFVSQSDSASLLAKRGINAS